MSCRVQMINISNLREPKTLYYQLRNNRTGPGTVYFRHLFLFFVSLRLLLAFQATRMESFSNSINTVNGFYFIFVLSSRGRERGAICFCMTYQEQHCNLDHSYSQLASLSSMKHLSYLKVQFLLEQTPFDPSLKAKQIVNLSQKAWLHPAQNPESSPSQCPYPTELQSHVSVLMENDTSQA